MNEPLLWEGKARESAALDALAGKLHLHGSDPGADAKNLTSLDKTNPEESPLWQEIIEEEETALDAEEETALDAEKKTALDAEKKTAPDAEKKLIGWWRWRRASSPSAPRGLLQRLRAAAARQPMLPIYGEHEKQMVEKREVLYTLALATPVAILTAAAGLNVFRGGWALVAGASVSVWILAASGMVMNQYTVFDLERLGARHLGRLGVLGAAVLFSFFTYRAFFPSTLWALWLLLIIAALALGAPWILSCMRGDDDVISASTKSSGDAAGRPGKTMDDMSSFPVSLLDTLLRLRCTLGPTCR